MSEENTVEEAAITDNASESVLNIKRVYLKDLSFETPMGLEGFNQKNPPKIEQEVNVQANKIDNKHHEVILLMTVTANIEGRVAFLIEVKQAGVFEISGVEGLKLGHAINSECPKILFPYVREAIDSILSKGAFPPLMMPQINFDAIFLQAIKDLEVRKGQENIGA